VEADFSVELGPEDESLEFPWSDPVGKLRYYDLKRNAEYISRLEEAQKFAPLGKFLARVNLPESPLETAKCDAWLTREMNVEDEDFNAAYKHGCYVDLLFSDARRFSFAAHEQLARDVSSLLKHAPEIPARAELLVRHCDYRQAMTSRQGFYITLYVFGYGSKVKAQQECGIGLELAANALAQVWASSQS